MKFGIYGNFSNGDGLCDFYFIDLGIMEKIYAFPYAFLLYSYLINKFLKMSYQRNSLDSRVFDFKLSEVDLGIKLSLKKVKKAMEFLHKEQIIYAFKVEKEDYWIIELPYFKQKDPSGQQKHSKDRSK